MLRILSRLGEIRICILDQGILVAMSELILQAAMAGIFAIVSFDRTLRGILIWRILCHGRFLGFRRSMKGFLTILIAVMVAGIAAWSSESQPSSSRLQTVSVKHHRATRHHAHKAGKHHHVKHHGSV